MQFDFISHFKYIGNQILSMFNLKAPSDGDDSDEGDNIQIELVDEQSPSIKDTKNFMNVTKQLSQVQNQTQQKANQSLNQNENN